MLDEVNSLPIQGVSINWDKIDRRSYLRGIDAIKEEYEDKIQELFDERKELA